MTVAVLFPLDGYLVCALILFLRRGVAVPLGAPLLFEVLKFLFSGIGVTQDDNYYTNKWPYYTRANNPLSFWFYISFNLFIVLSFTGSAVFVWIEILRSK